ncbi:two-component system response regulator DcuR [Anaerobacillus alkalidiazotrophicus]|uniref:Two-component system response regulator DcuR n=1 Tax=Anaerobacillus alkalidiazotrophicus TaxID=472963 RepID=A0A1S2M250_9BACI|nr:response regulator [Anaerobacillus alkalidiazotrophicus]OIJ18819.1 two-component system response regulator DcuR [Anaerobacillus alkalidiazotrophicus]
MLKVLIVEDDPMVAEFNRRYLEKIEGYELVAIAPSVDDAINILNENKVHLILLDIYMPNKTGWDLLSKIRSNDKEVDIIVISAACDNESIQKALRFGVVDYLIKPFEFERFCTALQDYKADKSMIDKQTKLKQEDLDNQFFNKNHKSVQSLELPKGLTKNTLQFVWEKIKLMEISPFSTEELANEVGISRVSLRKYLNFMNDINILKTDIVYGTVGRPVYKHQLISSDEEIIKRYL